MSATGMGDFGIGNAARLLMAPYVFIVLTLVLTSILLGVSMVVEAIRGLVSCGRRVTVVWALGELLYGVWMVVAWAVIMLEMNHVSVFAPITTESYSGQELRQLGHWYRASLRPGLVHLIKPYENNPVVVLGLVFLLLGPFVFALRQTSAKSTALKQADSVKVE